MKSNTAFLEHSINHNPALIFWIDSEGLLKYVNDTACHKLGYDQDELLDKTIFDIDILWSKEKYKDSFKQILLDGGVKFESKYRHKDKTIIPVSTNIYCYQIEGKDYLFCNAVDISNLKSLERSLRQMQYSIDNSQTMILWVAQDSNLLYVNKSAYVRLGYSRAEMLNLSFSDIAREFQPKSWEDFFKKLIKEKFMKIETEFRCKNNSQFPVEMLLNYLNFEGYEYIFVSIVDVSERMEFEGILKKSKNKYRRLIENINDVIFFIDEKGKIRYISPVVEKMLGYKSSDLLKKSFTTFLFKKDYSEIEDLFQRGLKGLLNDAEIRVKAKSGGLRWVRVRSHPVKRGNKIIGIQGFLIDITEKKHSEVALIDSETHYQTLLELAPDGILIVNDKGQIELINPMALKMFGFSREELLFHSLEILLPNRLRKTLREYCKDRSMDPHLPTTGKVHIVLARHRNGQEFQVEVSLAILKKKDNTLHYMSIIRDVREKKLLEQEIEKRRNYLASVLQNAPDAIITMNSSGHIVEWNEGAEKVFEYSRTEVEGKMLDEIVCPQDEKENAIVFSRLVLSGKPMPPSELVRQRKGGSLVNVIAAGSPIITEGQIDGAVIVYTDISLQKKTEEELILHREHLEDLVEKRTFALKRTNDQLEREIDERKQVEMALRENEKKLLMQKEELKAFNEQMVGRESRIIELKEEINRLCAELGREIPYPPIWDSPPDEVGNILKRNRNDRGNNGKANH